MASAIRRWMITSESVERPRSLASMVARSGGSTNKLTASGMRARTWRAPCMSISSITDRPWASAASTGSRRVP